MHPPKLRWMPHVNLLYPFLLDKRPQEQEESARRAVVDNKDWEAKARRDPFAAARAVAVEALAAFGPFEVVFDEFCYFKHARSCTVWLKPSGDGVHELQAALEVRRCKLTSAS